MSSPPGARPVTLVDIAKACQVSRWTVAHALRGGTGVSKATAARIVATAARLGYDSGLNTEARSLCLRQFGRRASHRLLAVVMPAHIIDLPYYSRLLRGIVDACTERGYALVLNDIYRAPEALDQTGHSLGGLIGSGVIDGLLIHPFHAQTAEQTVARLRSVAGFAERPILALAHALPSCPAVTVDLLPAYRMIAARALELGHRRFLVIQQESTVATAVGEVLAGRGLDPERHLRVFPLQPTWLRPDLAIGLPWSGTPTSLPDVGPLRSALLASPRPTVVLAPNDAYALQVWAVAQAAGLDVPRDLSVVGCDDTDPVPDGAGGNRLASVRLPLEDVGRAAAEWVFARLAGGEDPVPLPLVAVPVLRPSLAAAP